MLNKKKAVATAACGLLAIGLSISGAFAYMTAQKSVDNVFTIGSGIQDKITLSEPNWNPDAAKNLVANQTVAKDPTVSNNSNMDVYAFIEVTEPLITGNDGSKTPLFTYTVNSGWTQYSTTTSSDNTKKVTVYAYGTSSAMTKLGASKSATLFNNVTIYNFNSGNAVEGTEQVLTVKTYVIQADGIGTTTPAGVWNTIKGN